MTPVENGSTCSGLQPSFSATAAIVARAGGNEYVAAGKRVRTIFFLMRYEGEASREEDRGRAWRRYDDALKLLHYENTRQVLRQAHALSETR